MLPPNALFPKMVVAIVAGMLILISLFLALREARLAGQAGSMISTKAPLFVLTVVSFVLVVGWAIPPR